MHRMSFVVVWVLLLQLALAPISHAAGQKAKGSLCGQAIGMLMRQSPKWLQVKLIQFAEHAVNFMTRNRTHSGKTFPLGEGEDGVTVTVGKRIGQGFFGVVYHVTIEAHGARAAAKYPGLFEGGVPRTDLVIKFPQDVSFPIPSGPFTGALLQENREASDLTAKLVALGHDPIAGTEILAASTGGKKDPPFLIKPLLKNIANTKKLAETQERLTPVQETALRKIFDRAEVLSREYGVVLDIKPENLNWNDKTGEWEMYEISDQPLAGDTFLGGGFAGYVELVNTSLASYRTAAPR